MIIIKSVIINIDKCIAESLNELYSINYIIYIIGVDLIHEICNKKTGPSKKPGSVF